MFFLNHLHIAIDLTRAEAIALETDDDTPWLSVYSHTGDFYLPCPPDKNDVKNLIDAFCEEHTLFGHCHAFRHPSAHIAIDTRRIFSVHPSQDDDVHVRLTSGYTMFLDRYLEDGTDIAALILDRLQNKPSRCG